MTPLPWFLTDPDPTGYLTRPWVVLDLETTNLEKGNPLVEDNRVVCAAWCCSWDRKIKYARGGEFEQNDLVADLREVVRQGGFVVAHNAKFELQWLMRMGVEIYDLLPYDTMLGEYVLGGNRWMYHRLSLDKLNKKYGGTGKMRVVDALISGGVCPSEIREDWLRARVCKDVYDTLQVFFGQRRKLADEGKLACAYTRNILTPALAWIETRGLRLDRERVYEEYSKAVTALAAADADLQIFTGGLKWSSNPEKARYIYGRRKHPEEQLRHPSGLGFEIIERGKKTKQWPEGMPSTGQPVLERLKARTRRQKQFLGLLKEATKWNARVTKALQFYKGVVDQNEGVFYGQFNQMNTQTHRLSSSGRPIFVEEFDGTKSAQLQNQSREFKDLFRAKRDGWKVGEIDGSQLEFRVAAFLGRDSVALFDVCNDVDIHTFTASVLESVSEDAVEKHQRQDAKEHTFKPLYGGRSGTEQQKRYYQAFREKYHQLYDEQTRWTKEVLKTKKLRLPTGLEFYWPGTSMDARSGYVDNTPSIFNYPVQNFATGEIIPVALVFQWHRLRGYQTEIVNTVHDSTISEVAPGEEEYWRDSGLQAFTHDVYDYLDKVYGIDFNVPLGCGLTLGQRWKSPDAVECELNVPRRGAPWFKGERRSPPSNENVEAWDALVA